MKVSHVILRVRDMADALSFYRDVVGFSVLTEGPGFSFCDGGSIRIGLAVDPEGTAVEATTEVVLMVDDITGSYDAMLDRGVPFEVEPRAVMELDGRELHAAHFRDPDGHLWSVTGWV